MQFVGGEARVSHLGVGDDRADEGVAVEGAVAREAASSARSPARNPRESAKLSDLVGVHVHAAVAVGGGGVDERERFGLTAVGRGEDARGLVVEGGGRTSAGAICETRTQRLGQGIARVAQTLPFQLQYRALGVSRDEQVREPAARAARLCAAHPRRIHARAVDVAGVHVARATITSLRRRTAACGRVSISADCSMSRALSAGWSECFDRSARVVDREPLRVPRRGRTIARTRTARRGDRDVRDVRKKSRYARVPPPRPLPPSRARRTARARPYTPASPNPSDRNRFPDPAPAGRGEAPRATSPAPSSSATASTTASLMTAALRCANRSAAVSFPRPSRSRPLSPRGSRADDGTLAPKETR